MTETTSPDEEPEPNDETSSVEEPQDGKPESFGEVLGMGDVGRELLSNVRRGGAERFPTGYSLDRGSGTIGRGELGLLVGRAGVSKSSLFLNIISRTPSVPTIVFNMEMPRTQQALWLACMTFDLGVHADKALEILKAREPYWLYRRIAVGIRALERVYPGLYLANPVGHVNVETFMRIQAQLFLDYGYKAARVFIDHLGYLMPNDYSGTKAHCADLKAWALRDKIAVVCLQQGNRSTSDGKGRNDGDLPPTMTTAAYGGEEYADMGWGVYRPEMAAKWADPAYRDKHGAEWARIQGVTFFNCWKSRERGQNIPGVPLHYQQDSRRLVEPSEVYPAPATFTEEEERIAEVPQPVEPDEGLDYDEEG